MTTISSTIDNFTMSTKQDNISSINILIEVIHAKTLENFCVVMCIFSYACKEWNKIQNIHSLVTLLSIVQWNCIKNIYTDWLKNRRELNVTLLRCWQKCKTSLSSDQFFSQLFLAANLWMANLRLDKLWIEINLRNYSRTVLEVWTCSGALLLLWETLKTLFAGKWSTFLVKWDCTCLHKHYFSFRLRLLWG